MTTFDKVVHLLGVMATGALTTALSMGATLPVWAVIGVGAVAAGAQLTTSSVLPPKQPPKGYPPQS